MNKTRLLVLGMALAGLFGGTVLYADETPSAVQPPPAVTSPESTGQVTSVKSKMKSDRKQLIEARNKLKQDKKKLHQDKEQLGKSSPQAQQDRATVKQDKEAVKQARTQLKEDRANTGNVGNSAPATTN